jgi:LysR family transcriptional regulator, nod-box dependent transcriptional activator
MTAMIEEEGWSPVRRLNLNLLYPLDAILNAPSLTEAGRRVHLSQPAMSHSLRQLRDHFGDDLVAFRRGKQILTPLGQALRPEISRMRRELEGAFSLSLDFDPATTTRTIAIAAPETVEQMFLAPLLRRLTREAPEATFNMLPLDLSAPDRALELGADLIVLPSHAASEKLETSSLMEDRLS